MDVRQVLDGPQVVAQRVQDRPGFGGTRRADGHAEDTEAQPPLGVVPATHPFLADAAFVVGDHHDVAAHAGGVVELLRQQFAGHGQRSPVAGAAAQEGLREVDHPGDVGGLPGREAEDLDLVGGGEQDADEVALGVPGLIQQPARAHALAHASLVTPPGPGTYMECEVSTHAMTAPRPVARSPWVS